ncbi:sulfotransferase-like domain-containing protein [Streptomyces apocyni]|uniref:sulfotransferase-like domain-containing protein n=1 Tax=Streptomyces apocyni TaxID=2654677 RepID=UPI0012EA6E1B|nr:sulfotransferase family protein [Streptomyces apocyni]
MSEADSGPRVIALWSAPRSRSTAFFRSVMERGDLTGLHEPFCNIVDFGETTVDGAPVRSAPALISAVRGLSARQRVFLKETMDYRYAEVLADEAFLREVRHTFLIRRPAEVAASYYALKPDMSRKDIGLEHMHELYEAVLATGQHPVILDSDDVVSRPAETLAAYWAAVGLEHRAEALSWQPGEREEWARSDRWHADVNRSSGFTAVGTTYDVTVENNATLAEFASHHEPYYRSLYTKRLTVTPA